MLYSIHLIWSNEALQAFWCSPIIDNAKSSYQPKPWVLSNRKLLINTCSQIQVKSCHLWILKLNWTLLYLYTPISFCFIILAARGADTIIPCALQHVKFPFILAPLSIWLLGNCSALNVCWSVLHYVKAYLPSSLFLLILK